jgi:hypothetical protein
VFLQSKQEARDCEREGRRASLFTFWGSVCYLFFSPFSEGKNKKKNAPKKSSECIIENRFTSFLAFVSERRRCRGKVVGASLWV